MIKIIACILGLISNTLLLASDSTFVDEERILKSSTGNLYGSLLVPVEITRALAITSQQN